MTKQKSLQRFTDLEKLNTIKEVKEYLSNNPNSIDDIYDSLKNRISESYYNGLGKEYQLIEMLVSILGNQNKINDIRNTTYETNHSIITSFIHNYLLEYRTFPTMSTITEKTNLSRQTVYNHLNNGFLDKHNKLVRGKIEVMSIDALQKLYLIGIQDNNPTALKHFIQLSGLVSNNNTMQVNNYIQVNSLKISTEDISRLPQQDILEIEKIVSKTLLKNTLPI
jgi:DNA-binding phage protein